MRRWLKSAFFMALEVGQINRLFRHLNRGRIKVLLYHSITPQGQHFDNGLGSDEFVIHIQYLKKYFNVISADQLDSATSIAVDRVNILITFDDGFIDNRTVAASLLHRAKLPAIFFVIAACVPEGLPPNFIGYGTTRNIDEPAFRTMTVADLRAILQQGMTFGSHGMTHPDYSKIPFGAGIIDGQRSKAMLEALLPESNITCFAFPWGRFQDGQEIELLKSYHRVFLTSHGFNHASDRVMHRNEVSDVRQLGAAASGALDFFRAMFNSAGK